MVLDTYLLSTRQYTVRIKGKVEQSRERSSALPYTSMYQLLKREPYGRPLLRSPTYLQTIVSCIVHSNSFICTQLNGFKLCNSTLFIPLHIVKLFQVLHYVILIIQIFDTVKRFQAFQFNSHNYIFNIRLHTVKWFKVFLFISNNSISHLFTLS